MYDCSSCPRHRPHIISRSSSSDLTTTNHRSIASRLKRQVQMWRRCKLRSFDPPELRKHHFVTVKNQSFASSPVWPSIIMTGIQEQEQVLEVPTRVLVCLILPTSFYIEKASCIQHHLFPSFRLSYVTADFYCTFIQLLDWETSILP